MRTLLLGLLAIAVIGCTRPNPRFCSEDEPTCPGGGTCNFELNACPDADAVCELSTDCDDPNAPLCGDDGLCRPCSASDEGRADCPVCNPDGSCEACSSDASCPAAAPRCEGGVCAACAPDEGGDALCSARDTEAPYCHLGGCVACATNEHCPAEVAPHCDPETFTCGPCARDDECASGVCDEAGGRCVDPAAVLYVDATSGQSGDCTLSEPCRELAEVMAELTPERRTVFAFPGLYRSNVSLTETADVHIVGALAGGVIWRPDSGIALQAFQSTGIVVERLQIEASDGEAIRATSSDIAVLDSVLQGSARSGLRVSGGSATVERCTIAGNDAGGLYASDGATLRVVNNFLLNNGNGIDETRGGADLDGVSGTFAFNTVVANRVRAGDRAPGVHCGPDSDVTISSTIVWDNMPAGAAASVIGCPLRYSDVEDLDAVAPDLVDDTSLSADPRFAGATDFHITAGSPCQDAGDPDADVAVDVDAQPRLDRPDIGADELAP